MLGSPSPLRFPYSSPYCCSKESSSQSPNIRHQYSKCQPPSIRDFFPQCSQSIARQFIITGQLPMLPLPPLMGFNDDVVDPNAAIATAVIAPTLVATAAVATNANTIKPKPYSDDDESFDEDFTAGDDSDEEGDETGLFIHQEEHDENELDDDDEVFGLEAETTLAITLLGCLQCLLLDFNTNQNGMLQRHGKRWIILEVGRNIPSRHITTRRRTPATILPLEHRLFLPFQAVKEALIAGVPLQWMDAQQCNEGDVFMSRRSCWRSQASILQRLSRRYHTQEAWIDGR